MSDDFPYDFPDDFPYDFLLFKYPIFLYIIFNIYFLLYSLYISYKYYNIFEYKNILYIIVINIMPPSKYMCIRCDSYECKNFIDIKKHCLRKNPCKKKSDVILLSDDQILVMSLLPYYNDIHNIELTDLEHLSKSKLLDKNKKDLFNEIDVIEKQKDKKCKYCNEEYSLISDLKKHVITKCFFNELSKNISNNSINNEIVNNINSNNSISNSYNTINSNNTTNNYNIYLNIPIPFEDDWDITKIPQSEKQAIMISQFMYRRLLQSILDNEKNSNVIIDKDKDLGMVYMNHNKKYIQMKSNEIVEQTMNKLNSQLNEINENDKDSLKTIKKYSKKMINKKFDDYKKNKDIKKEVQDIVCNIYDENNEKAYKMAKNIDQANKLNLIEDTKTKNKMKTYSKINEHDKQYESSDDDNDYLYDSDGELKY